MHLTRVENSDIKRVSLFWHTRYSETSLFAATENAAANGKDGTVENAGAENVAPECIGGKARVIDQGR